MIKPQEKPAFFTAFTRPLVTAFVSACLFSGEASGFTLCSNASSGATEPCTTYQEIFEVLREQTTLEVPITGDPSGAELDFFGTEGTPEICQTCVLNRFEQTGTLNF